MRLAWLAIVVLITSVSYAQTPSNKKEQVPTAILLNSRYVYVEAWDGDYFNPHLLLEDRKAILDVQNAFHDWNRYLITVKRHDAEIIVVVQKGRIASVNAGVGGGKIQNGHAESSPDDELGSNQPKPKGGDRVGAGPEVAGRDDLFFVYLVNPDRSLTGPIWMHHQKDGLDAPDIPLFKQFKDSMDAAAEVQTSKAQTSKAPAP
jgi:hypothetical protein